MKPRGNKYTNDWATPAYLYNKLNEEFNFNFDPCPFLHDKKEWDGLLIDWGSRNFVNPPYSLKEKVAFVEKAVSEANKKKLCVCLLPVSTSTKLFHGTILPNAKEIRFLEKRVKFSGYNSNNVWVTDKTGMHDSMIVIFDKR